MKLFERRIIGIKQETTQGTPVVPAATDYILVNDLIIKHLVAMHPLTRRSSSLDRFARKAGQRHVEVTFKTEVHGPGASQTVPEAPLDALWQACGFTSATTGTTPNIITTYAPTSAAASSNYYGPGKSVTLEVYEDGTKHIIAGTMGSVKITCEAGQPAMLEWTLRGKYTAPTDASFPSQTYNTTEPPIFESASLLIGGFSATITKVEIDVANRVTLRRSANASSGVLGFSITAREPVGSFDPEVEAISTHDFITKLMTDVQAQLSFQIGSAVGNKVTLTFPKAQYIELSEADRDGIFAYEIGLAFNRNSGDDWANIVYAIG